MLADMFSEGEDAANAETEGHEVECADASEILIKIAKDPGDPTLEDVEAHNATHLPYRAWCPVCVKAAGREGSHWKQRESQKSIKPTFRMDYKSFGQEDDVDDKATMIVMKETNQNRSQVM